MKPVRFGHWIFLPHLVPSLATALLLPLFIVLGLWQLQRGEDKRALMATAEARAALPPLDLNALREAWPGPASLAWRPVRVRGTWDPAHQVLLDNQVADGQPGYLVFTPLRLEGGRSVLVNRGWIGGGLERDRVPDLHLDGATVVVTGVAAPPPPAGLWVRSDFAELLAPDVLRVQRLDPASLSGRLGIELEAFTIRLDVDQPDGYRRAWSIPGLHPERHTAYAIQWFLFAAILLGLYLHFNVKADERLHPRDLPAKPGAADHP